MRIRDILIAFLLVALAAAVTVPGAQAADSVTLRLDWVVGSEHAPIYLAVEKGFFRDEGIDLKILAGEGSTVTVKLVGNKNNDFGYATADQALMAYAKGLPVVATAVVLQKSPSAIIFPKAKPLTRLEDLYGKKLGTQIKSVVDKQWEAVTRIHKIDRKKITEIPSDRAVAAFIANGNIDAAVAWFFNDGLQLEVKGIPMSWMLFSDLGLQMYSTSLLVHEDTIKQKPDLVRRFTRAFIKGWTYSKAHPDEALALFLKANPAADPAYSRLKLPAVLSLTDTPDTRQHGIGYSTRAGWEGMQKALIDQKLMDSPVDVSKVFTTEYLK